MITKERNIKLFWKLNPSVFQVINLEAMGEYTRKLGSAVNVVNTLCSQTEEMKVLLPIILGVSPDNTSVNWQSKVSNYWHNFALEVLPTGLTFDIGFRFNLHDTNDVKRIKAIEVILKKTNVKDTDSETVKEKALVDYLFGTNKDGNRNVTEEELYQYGTPLNIPDYLSWRYCLLTSQVANNPEDVNKSNKIRFYLHNEEDAKKTRRDATIKSTSAIKVYAEMMGKDDSLERMTAICISNKLVSWIEFKSKDWTDSDTQAIVLQYATDKPIDFLAAASDKNLLVKSTIQSYIYEGLLVEIPSSSIITDASDPSIVLGDNLNDAIAYFSNDTNKAYLSGLKAKFKSLK